MNILFINNNVFDRKVGGLERSTINIIESLLKEKDIQCYTLYNDYNEHINGVYHLKGIFNENLNIDKIIEEHKIDLLFFPCGPWYPYIFSQISKHKIKIITQYHSAPGYEKIFYLKKLLNSLRAYGLKMQIKTIIKIIAYNLNKKKYNSGINDLFNNGIAVSSCFVLLSREYILPFKTCYQIKESQHSKIYSIPNSLPFKIDINDNIINLKENRILIVSRMDNKNKRIKDLLNIWNDSHLSVTDWYLDILGDGPDLSNLQAYSIKHQIKNVTFFGKQNPIEFYKRAKIFIMASNWEGMPMTILEAKQMGCVPIVYNTFASLKELISDNIDGFIINNNNHHDFIKKLQYLANNNIVLKQMGENSLKNSANFSQKNVSQQWLKLIRHVYAQ